MKFESYIEATKRRVERSLDRLLPLEETYPEVIHRAMRYMALGGGKRLRPLLVFLAYRWCGGTGYPRRVLFAATAVELIHTYSLIHDDLPAMDNDDFRRGRESCHKKFGEAIAILAGDALHAKAFELLARTGNNRVVREVAQAIGTDGLVGGQVMDIVLEGKTGVSKEELYYIHRHKTAALIMVSLKIGAILADASPRYLRILTSYGEKVGLAFQIKDDILDVTSTREELGKTTKKDKEKVTFPAVFGLKESEHIAQKLVDEAKQLLPRNDWTPHLYSLADLVITRKA